MKKSFVKALEEAQKHSEKFPTIHVWVMDKPRKSAVVCASDFVRRERILDGWATVAEFKGGNRLR